MNITTKELRQIIIEEIEAVTEEEMIDPVTNQVGGMDQEGNLVKKVDGLAKFGIRTRERVTKLEKQIQYVVNVLQDQFSLDVRTSGAKKKEAPYQSPFEE